MGQPGDGQKGFFEGKFFDFARGREGKALAAKDRADHFQRKSEKNMAKAERLSPEMIDEASDDDVVIQAGGRAANVKIPQLRRMKAILRAQAEINREQAEALEAASEAITAQQEEIAELKERAGRAFSAIRARLQNDDENFGFLSDTVLASVNGLVEVINVTDEIQSPIAKAAAAIMSNLAASDRFKGPQERLMLAGAVLLNAAAYYDAAAGLNSILAGDSGDLLPSLTGPVTATPVDWVAVEAAMRNEGNATAADWVAANFP